MIETDDIYRATISELFDNFRHALLAILPMADQARINYRDEETHRDWERLAECLFDVFVRSPIDSDRSATGSELPLARYDIDLGDYRTMSWLAIDAASPYRGAVVRFLSQGSPFDTLQVVDIDPVTLHAGARRTIAASGTRPVLYRRSHHGEDRVTTHIEAIE